MIYLNVAVLLLLLRCLLQLLLFHLGGEGKAHGVFLLATRLRGRRVAEAGERRTLARTFQLGLRFEQFPTQFLILGRLAAKLVVQLLHLGVQLLLVSVGLFQLTEQPNNILRKQSNWRKTCG